MNIETLKEKAREMSAKRISYNGTVLGYQQSILELDQIVEDTVRAVVLEITKVQSKTPEATITRIALKAGNILRQLGEEK